MGLGLVSPIAVWPTRKMIRDHARKTNRPYASREPDSRERKGTHHMKTRLVMTALCLLFGEASLLHAESPTGKLTGRIIYTGQAPLDHAVEVARDSSFCGASIMVPSVTVHPKTRGLEGAVVSVESDSLPTADSPRPPLVLANNHCAFSPRTVVGQVGQHLEIRNDDPVMHNTHISLGPRTFINVAMIPGSRPVGKPLKQPGTYSVKCDAHKFMHGNVIAFSHPFFSITDETGAFEIANLPAGEHLVTIWHDILGTHQQTVTIPAHGEATISIEYPIHAAAKKK